MYEPPIKNEKQLLEKNIPLKIPNTVALSFLGPNKYLTELSKRHIPMGTMAEVIDLPAEDFTFATTQTDGNEICVVK